MNEALSALQFGEHGFGDEVLLGAWMTLQIAVTSLAVGMVIGIITALAKLSKYWWWRWLAEGYTALIRGIPEFLVLLLIFFGLSRLVQSVALWFGYNGYIEVSAFFAGVTALSLIFGAFASEVLRSAFLAIPVGQTEAAAALGMHRFIIFWWIQLPQIWRHALPGLGNLWMVLLKDTALVSVIALDELLRWSKVAAEATNQPFTFYFVAMLLYLLMTIMSNIVLYYAEQRAQRGITRVEHHL